MYCTQEKGSDRKGTMGTRRGASDTRRPSTPEKRVEKEVLDHEEEEKPRPQVMAATPSNADTVHRHHSGAFHGAHHIIEHLSKAIGQDLRGISSRPSLRSRAETSQRSNTGSRVAPSRTPQTIQNLEPLIKVQAIASLSSFQYAQDPIPPGHPGDKLPIK